MNLHKDKSSFTLAALIHLSTFSKYIVPLGNFIFPLVVWTASRKERFIDHHGKQALNFQISIFFYMILLVGLTMAGILLMAFSSGVPNVSIPDDLFRLSHFPESFPFLIILAVASVLLLGLFILEIVCVIAATVRASEGDYYKYPLTINFIGTSSETGEEPINDAAI